MVYDDIIIGSGLSALGTGYALPKHHRVAIIAGHDEGEFQPYSAEHDVPCAYDGFGGLGNAWHGVIPLKLAAGSSGFGLSESDLPTFQEMFAFFYPETDTRSKIGGNWAFVPRRAIRPKIFWPKISARFQTGLDFVPHLAKYIEPVNSAPVRVTCSNGDVLRGHRLWLCSGALGTPRLLQASFGLGAAETISDHVLIYLGRSDARRVTPPVKVRTDRASEGFFLGVDYAAHNAALLTARPARFDFAPLDSGFARRASFGLPMKSALWRILKAPSPGLIAEAFFNRYALFPQARFQSVYAQLRVPDALRLNATQGTVDVRKDHIRTYINNQRRALTPTSLEPSQRPELFLPLIHIHHSIDQKALESIGINTPTSAVQINDASGINDIGPEHHSFKMMLRAAKRASIA